jgi:predicted P-loop ATPase/GTPase
MKRSSLSLWERARVRGLAKTLHFGYGEGLCKLQRPSPKEKENKVFIVNPHPQPFSQWEKGAKL